MEVQCPKCHFNQPKDQYCARCGVDMQKFKPQSTSVFKKFNLQTSILFLIAMAVLGVTIFIFQSNDKPLINSLNQVSAVKSFRSTEQNSSTENSANTTVNVDNQSGASPANSKEVVDLKVADTVQLDELAGDNESSSANSAKMDAEKTNPRVKISFVEISVDQLAAMTSESSNIGLLQKESDSLRAILPNISSLAQYSYKTLKQDIKEIRPNQIEAFFFGKTSSENSQFQGLQINLERKATESSDTSSSKWVLSIQIAKSDRKETENIDLSLNRNAVFFATTKNWLMGFENERTLADVQPFSTLSSPDFLNQRSEIIIILEIY